MDDDESNERTVYRAPHRGDRLLDGMKNLRETDHLCDVVLRLDNDAKSTSERSIRAHRLVLASSSRYFRAMFAQNHGFAETRQETIRLRDVDPDVVESLIDFMYTSTLEIETDRVQALLQTAARFQLDEIVAVCGDFILDRLHHFNCLGIRQFAAAHGCADLLRAADAYVRAHFVRVTAVDEFLALDVDDARDLLASDDIVVEGEEAVAEAALRWLRHDLQGRREHARAMLHALRLPALAPNYLAERLGESDLFRDDSYCLRMIVDALAMHSRMGGSAAAAAVTGRKSTLGCIVAVGGMDSLKGATTVEVYDPRLDEWNVVARVNSKRLQFGVAVVDDLIYIVGGRDGLKTLNSVLRYEASEKKWRAVSPMCTHRHGVGVGSLHGPIYAVGGHDGWSYLNSVERFDLGTFQWSFVAPMKVPRSTVSVGVLNDRLYAVGGRDSASCVRTVEFYSPHTNRWTEVAPLSQARAGLGVTVLNEKLYAIGGHDNNVNFATVERYDPLCNQWTTLAPMSIGRNSVGTVAFGGKIYAVGGYSGVSYLSSVEVYDDDKEEWSKVADMKIGRAGAGVIVLKSKDLVLST